MSDLVNVADPEDPVNVRRGRILQILPDGFQVHFSSEDVVETVPLSNIRQRLVLPWRPEDLRDHFIILRRRNGSKDDYIEDLRVRRNWLKRIMLLLTHRGEEWRPGHPDEALHMFYTEIDLRPETEIEEIFEEDAVPDGLNFQDTLDDERVTELSYPVFDEWLSEG